MVFYDEDGNVLDLFFGTFGDIDDTDTLIMQSLFWAPDRLPSKLYVGVEGQAERMLIEFE